METNQTTPSANGLSVAALAYDLTVSTNSNYGTSKNDVLFFALMGYRDSQLKNMLTQIKDGETEEAYDAFNDFNTATALLDDMVLGLSNLAQINYWHSQHQDQLPEAMCQVATDADERYERFLKLTGLVDKSEN